MSALRIGVYDSGVGGLSVLPALKAALPSASFLYVSDRAHAPYGDRPADFVRARALAVAGFLHGQQAQAMVIACNTASVLAAASVRAQCALPVVAMEPAIKPAALHTRSKVVLVLATTNTVNSPAVARLCAAHGAGLRILLQACPGLAERIERGEGALPATRALLADWLRPGLAAGADTVVLGCTHYAFVAEQIAAIAGPSVRLVEPSAAIARQLLRLLLALPPGQAPAGDVVFYSSAAPDSALAGFAARAGFGAPWVHRLPC